MGFFTDHFGAFVIPDPVYSKPTAKRIFNARPHIVKIRRAIEGSGFEIINSRGNGYALVRVEK